jgi:hypothetical protein
MTSCKVTRQERHWSDTDSVISCHPVIENSVHSKGRLVLRFREVALTEIRETDNKNSKIQSRCK